ncbi:hypothetical protein MSG28_010602 [Choristoneura fumiferana]|uniref:Uncharacterized protein n=1 Tax=Choristoneura fumiferana TaxID=7141 RepID=A0ACC0KNU6_CHOFU|nr:hypothetical protein MSG28_010602 [Choristoneura fumiferana]
MGPTAIKTGLIVYLAHIGSFVPARSATIGIIRHMRSRLRAAECVAAHMSAFLIDLKQMELALQESTSNSLIIIDEFGKGTSEVDGLSLLAACLNTFLFQGGDCPHIFLSTHFLNIKDYIVETPLVRFLRFEYVMDGDAPVFLFRVTQGCAESSFAAEVARASGVSQHVLARASEVATSMKNNSLPPPNEKIIAKLRAFTEMIKTDLAEDI